MASQTLVKKAVLPSDIIIYAVLAEGHIKGVPRIHSEVVKRIRELENPIDINNVSISGGYSEDLDRVISLLGPSAIEEYSPIKLHSFGFEVCLDVIKDYFKDPEYNDQIAKLLNILDVRL